MLKIILFFTFVTGSSYAQVVPGPTPGPSRDKMSFPNYECLRTIKSADAETVADQAHQCALADPLRIETIQCRETSSDLQVDEEKRLESLATTPLTSFERKLIEDAASTITYDCLL